MVVNITSITHIGRSVDELHFEMTRQSFEAEAGAPALACKPSPPPPSSAIGSR